MLWVSLGNIPANFLQGHWQRCSTPFAINDFCNYSWDLPKWNWWSILLTTIFKWHIGRHTIYSKLGFDLYHLVERCSPTQFSNLSAAFCLLHIHEVFVAYKSSPTSIWDGFLRCCRAAIIFCNLVLSTWLYYPLTNCPGYDNPQEWNPA